MVTVPPALARPQERSAHRQDRPPPEPARSSVLRASRRRRAVGHVRRGVQHHADDRRGDRQRRGAADELAAADDAVDARLDQPIDAVEVGSVDRDTDPDGE